MMLIDETGLNIRRHAIWGDFTHLSTNVVDPDLSDWMDIQHATQIVLDATQVVIDATQSAADATQSASEAIAAGNQFRGCGDGYCHASHSVRPGRSPERPGRDTFANRGLPGS